MKQLTFADSEAVEVGVWLEHPFEHGCIMSIDYELEEVHVYDGKEGWTLSSANNNLEPLKFVERISQLGRVGTGLTGMHQKVNRSYRENLYKTL